MSLPADKSHISCNPMAAPHTQRDRVIRMVRADHSAAHALAQEIEDPWNRCQALAWAARFAPDHAVARILDEAFSAAWACSDPYKRVAVSAWPFRAMVERDHMDKLDGMVGRLLQTAVEIQHPVSRLDALFLVWQALFPLGSTARSSVQEVLLQACCSTEGWRARRTLRDIVLTIGRKDMAEAKRIVELMPESEYRKEAADAVATGNWQRPRRFFWGSFVEAQ